MNRNMKAVTWAMQQRELDPGPFRLLIMLAGRVGKKNFEVWPSYERMAEDSRIGKSTARRYIDELMFIGLVEKVGFRARRYGGRGVNVYALKVTAILIDEDDDIDEFDEEQSAQIEQMSGHSYGHAQVSTGEHCIEPLKGGTSINEDSTPTPTGQAAKEYAFQGKTIRLTKPDYARWEASFNRLDLGAELAGLDGWISQQDETTRKRWFGAVSGALAKKQREARDRDRKRQQDREDGGHHEFTLV